MAQLGSVLGPEDGRSRGPDLVARVCVPRPALGHAEGYRVHVPRELEHEGRPVVRVRSPHEEGDEIQLYLPEGFPDGGSLRLRGQGGASEGGPPGDLLVRVELLEGRPSARAGAAVGGLSGAELLWLGVAALIVAGAVFVGLQE